MRLGNFGPEVFRNFCYAAHEHIAKACFMRRILFIVLIGFALFKALLDKELEIRPTATPTPGSATPSPTGHSNQGVGEVPPKTAPDQPVSPRSPASGRTALYVSGSIVRVRAGPGTSYERITAFKRGHMLAATGERDGKWIRIFDEDSQTDGWMHGDYLSKTPTAALEAVKGPPPSARAPSGPSDRDLRKQIIANSIVRYPGSCPCPYSRDRAGRKCGNRSAWSRRGGYTPICYENEVDDRMVQAWKTRN